MALKFCNCAYPKCCRPTVRQVILLVMTLASFLETTYFGMWFAFEMTNRIPSLKPYSIQHWISLVIVIFGGFTLILSCLAYQTVFSEARNINRYQKVTPLLLIASAAFFIFGLTTFAIYVGVQVTPEDFFTSLQRTRGVGKIHYQTDDGFELPPWLNNIQSVSKCCGIKNYKDFDRNGRLNNTKLTRGMENEKQLDHTYELPVSCCSTLEPNQTCGKSIFELNEMGQRKDSIIFKQGCMEFILEEITKLEMIGTIGSFVVSLLCFLTFVTLVRSRKEEINKFVGERNRSFEERYKLSDGYFAHLGDIYMDVIPDLNYVPLED